MAVAMGIGRFVYTPILPMMLDAGALSAAQAGLVAGFNYLGYLIGALAAVSGRFAPCRRHWLFAALAASAATTGAMAFADGLVAMMALRFASGVASAFVLIFVTTLVMARLAAERRPRLAAVHFGGVGLGIAASAVLVSLLAAGGLNWPGTWLAAGLAALVGLAGVVILLPVAAAETPPPPRRPGDRAGSAPLALFIASYGCFGFGYVITATFINAMARSEPALLAAEPYVWVAVGLAGMPSVWLWNLVASRVGPMTAYGLACAVEAAGVGLSVAVPSPLALIASAVLLGATFIAITALGLARAREMAPADPAGAIALMTASFGLGQMIGPVVAGWLFERLGDLVAASWLAALGLVAAALLALLSALSARR